MVTTQHMGLLLKVENLIHDIKIYRELLLKFGTNKYIYKKKYIFISSFQDEAGSSSHTAYNDKHYEQLFKKPSSRKAIPLEKTEKHIKKSEREYKNLADKGKKNK